MVTGLLLLKMVCYVWAEEETDYFLLVIKIHTCITILFANSNGILVKHFERNESVAMVSVDAPKWVSPCLLLHMGGTKQAGRSTCRRP